MSGAASVATFEDYQNAVDGEIEVGVSFGRIEDLIDACLIDDEQKAAL